MGIIDKISERATVLVIGPPLSGKKELLYRQMQHSLVKNEPVGKEQKESSEELPQVETARGQDGIHAIAFFSLQVVSLQAVIRLQMAKDRFDLPARCTIASVTSLPAPR